jgi:cell wall-associated NlpC family hydrolase
MKKVLKIAVLTVGVLSLIPMTAFASDNASAVSNKIEISQSKVAAGALTIQDHIAETALSLSGTPYKNAGTTIKGFDASAFVQYAYAKNNIKLPRTTADMYKQGTAVEQKDLHIGDLVFFNTSSTKKGATFVGIYKGEGKFIAVTINKGVSVQKLSDKYWKDNYIGAKNIIK